MVFQSLTKLWQTIGALRQLDKTTPEKLRVAAAQNVAMQKAVQRRKRESQEAMAGLAQALSARMEEATQAEEAKVAQRLAQLQQKLDSIKIDPDRVREKAVNELLTKWEATLEGPGGRAGSSAGVDGTAAANGVRLRLRFVRSMEVVSPFLCSVASTAHPLCATIPSLSPSVLVTHPVASGPSRRPPALPLQRKGVGHKKDGDG